MIRTYAYMGVVLAIIGLTTTTVYLHKSLQKARKERGQATEFALSNAAQVTWYKNKMGVETAKIKVLELTTANLKRLQESERLAFVKELAGVKRNLRNVAMIQTGDLTIRDTTTILMRERLGGGKFFADSTKYTTTYGSVSGDTIKINRVEVVPLQGAVLWERRKGFLGLRWFGKKEYHFHLSSPNPNVRITGLELIQVNKK